MTNHKPGFAVVKVLFVCAILLMAALLAMKISTDKKSAQLAAQKLSAVPAAQQAELGQALPEEATKMPPPTEASSPGEPAEAPLRADGGDCLREHMESADSLLAHFTENYQNYFGPSLADADAMSRNSSRKSAARPSAGEVLDLFSDLTVCSVLSGRPVSCVGDLGGLCISAEFYEFLNSSFNNTPQDGKCQQFLDSAFSGSSERPSRNFCAVAAAALSKRRAPDCSKLGSFEGCAEGFVFLKGRAACQALKGKDRKECQFGAALASGANGAPEDWLPKVMGSRSPEACIPLAEKLAAGFCKSKLRREVLNDNRVREARDRKRIAAKKAAGRGK